MAREIYNKYFCPSHGLPLLTAVDRHHSWTKLESQLKAAHHSPVCAATLKQLRVQQRAALLKHIYVLTFYLLQFMHFVSQL